MTHARSGKVLVVGDNDLAGLATVRSLGRAGLAVHLVSFEKPSITRWSRYVRRTYDLGHPLTEPTAFADRFLALVRDQPFDLAIPTSDKALLPLMKRRGEIEDFTRLAAPDDAGFTVTQDKERTLHLANQLGITVPRSQILRTVADMDRLEMPSAFPVVLKPTQSVMLETLARNEVVIVRSAAELRARLPGLLARCPVLVQEFCRGYGVGVVVVADRGTLIGALQHERVHEPPEGGASSYRKTVPLSPDLLEAARQLCAALHWTGPAMIEFKVHPETGAAVLMEINGRLWGSLALAIQAGFDVPRVLHDLLVLGDTRPIRNYRVPFYVRHTTRDLDWLRANFRAPAGRPDLLRKSVGQVIGEVNHVLRGREGYDLESLIDPLPAVRAWLAFAGRGLNFLGRRWRIARDRRLATARLDRLPRPRSVLFVCHGNINRSAVAEALLRDLCRDANVEIASAGLLQREGNTPGPVSVEVAGELGVDLTAHRSSPLTADRLRRFDLVLVMEAAHYDSVRRLDPEALHKTFLLSSFAETGVGSDIEDPDGKSAERFREVYQQVIQSTQELARWLAVRHVSNVPENPLSRAG
jgi:protein-tyrosine-phosphatase/predicted ATP-grasp superfamily ATP-dependent carboligase